MTIILLHKVIGDRGANNLKLFPAWITIDHGICGKIC